MANSFFRFKQFTIWHEKCAMKVGTDGVLLGAWSNVTGAERILDIGTGTGLVALMIAQRSAAQITALEIDVNAALQARDNVAASPWADRVEVIHTDFGNYTSDIQFDLIVSNPPYFVDSLKCPIEQRAMARHDESLDYYTLFRGAVELLDPRGRFCIIIPTDVADVVIDIASGFGLYPTKRLDVITTPGKPPKRTLFEFAHTNAPCVSESMLLEIRRHVYSPEYIALTQHYYINM